MMTTSARASPRDANKMTRISSQWSGDFDPYHYLGWTSVQANLMLMIGKANVRWTIAKALSLVMSQRSKRTILTATKAISHPR